MSESTESTIEALRAIEDTLVEACSKMNDLELAAMHAYDECNKSLRLVEQLRKVLKSEGGDE